MTQLPNRADSPTDALETVTTGRGQPRVVFVHGTLDRGQSFDRVAALLADECTMVWYDRRGYGGSVQAAGVPVDVEGHAEDLIRILNGRPAVVVGHSMGGLTVLAAARRAPELVQAVVLYESEIPWAPLWNDEPIQAALKSDDPETEAIRMMLRRRFDQMSAEERQGWRDEARAFLVEAQSVRTGQDPFDLGKLEPPFLYAHSGIHSFPGVADYLIRTLPEAEIVVLPGGGHNLHRSQPGTFADLVRRGIVLGQARAEAD